MAISITSDFSLISNCDATTGWSGGATNSNFHQEGSACLGAKVSNTTSIVYEFTFGAAVDMTGLFFMMTMLVTGKADSIANGGYRITVEDGSANTGTWYVGGNDTHPGGWGFFPLDPSTTPTSGSGTIDITDITKVGVQFKTLSTSLGNNSNCFWDICHYGSTITGTSALSDTVTWQDFADADLTNFWGIIQKINGVYFAQGKIEIGNGAGSPALDVNFNDSGNVLVFLENDFLDDTAYELSVLGQAAGTTNFTLQNGLIKGDVRKPTLTLTDTNLDTCVVTGQTFQNLLRADISAATTTKTTFDGCGQVDPSTAIFNNIQFTNSTDPDGALLWPASANTHTCTFTNCDLGVEITQTVDQDFVAMSFDDSAGSPARYDVNLNNGGTDITVALDSNSNANSYIATGSPQGVVTFSSSVTLSMTVKDQSGAVITGAFASINDEAGGSPIIEIMNTTTNGSGLATTNHTGGAVTGSTWRVRKYGYKAYRASVDIASADIAIPVTLVTDPQQT